MSCSRTMGRAALLTLALGASLALQACAGDPHASEMARNRQLLPTEQYGITVTTEPEQIALGLHPSGLSATQEAALGQFVSRWRANGGGRVSLRAPVGGDAALSRRMEDAAGEYMVKLGVPREQLAILGYAPQVPGPAPLLVSYDRFEAQGPNCSGGWNNLTSTFSNRSSNHFGCAVTANIAAQVANPRDFLAPAVETPADNSRRAVVLGKYRAGQLTSSAKDDQANGKVSETSGGGN
jgi:pilus assembly protein CpaD